MQDVIKKCRFKGAGVILNAPAEIETEFKKMGFKTSFDKTQKSENTLIFLNNSKEFLSFLHKELKNVASDGVLWLAYPKGSSKIKTDINRDTLRSTAENFGITTVTAISVNEIWSALRFRPIDKVGK